MKSISMLLAGVAVLVAPTTAAFAQEGEVPTGSAQDSTVTAEPSATEEGAVTDEYADNEIIVTATGRNQVAQDVPIAVSVVGGETLANAGISDIRGIRQVTPSLQVTTGQSSATGVVLRIRGIGTAGDNPGFEPAVGVFIDGVFRARAGVALADLPPIERVEVLRGPQGTLFGRNTSAGALSITTRAPAFELGGYAEASYGNYDEIEVKAGVTGPVSETVALRVDGGYHKRDGYIRDANADRRFNNLDRWFARGQTQFETDTVTVRLIGDYAKTDEDCCGALNTGSGFVLGGAAGAASAVIEALAGANGLDGIVRPFDAKGRTMATSPNRDLSERVKEWGVSGQVDWELGDVTLTSITAYRDWKARRSQDIDFSGVDRAYRDNYRTGLKDFTQEVRLKGSAFDDKLDWLVGGFYLNEKNTLTDTVRFGTQGDAYVDNFINLLTDAAVPGPGGFQVFGTITGRPTVGQVLLASNPTLAAAAAAGGPTVLATFLNPFPATPAGAGQVADRYQVDTQAFAAFTHNIVQFTDQLSLTLGLRYNYEKKDIDANLNAVVPACGFLQSPQAALLRAGLAGLNAQLGPDGRPSNLGDAIVNLSCNPTINSEFNGAYDGDRSESALTGTAKLAFKVNDDVLVYGGYDRGYKSGGYNLDRSSFDTRFLRIDQTSLTSPLGNGAQIDDLEFGKETVDSFEIGAKTNFTRAFQFNASAFYSRIKGYQNLAFTGSFFEVQNFEKVISKGVELESIFRPGSDLMLALNYTLLDTEVRDAGAGNDNGRPLTNSPRHVVTGAATWTPQLSDDVGALLHIDWRVNGDANTLNDPAGIPFTTNDGYGIVNARVGLNFGDGKYSIEGYVENVFDTYYNVTAFPVPEQSSSFAVYPSSPRFYGVKVGAKF